MGQSPALRPRKRPLGEGPQGEVAGGRAGQQGGLPRSRTATESGTQEPTVQEEREMGSGGVERKEKRKKPREEEEMDQVGTKAPSYCLLQGHTPQPHSAAPTPTRRNPAQPAHHFTASGPSRIQTVADSKDRQRVKISPSAGHTVHRAEQRGKFSITGHLNH